MNVNKKVFFFFNSLAFRKQHSEHMKYILLQGEY